MEVYFSHIVSNLPINLDIKIFVSTRKRVSFNVEKFEVENLHVEIYNIFKNPGSFQIPFRFLPGSFQVRFL